MSQPKTSPRLRMRELDHALGRSMFTFKEDEVLEQGRCQKGTLGTKYRDVVPPLESKKSHYGEA